MRKRYQAFGGGEGGHTEEIDGLENVNADGKIIFI